MVIPNRATPPLTSNQSAPNIANLNNTTNINTINVNSSYAGVTVSVNNRLFSDNFWGDKINGFDVLCQNLKHSLNSVKELETFFRDCANCEDTYAKVLNKLVTQTNKFSSNGTFSPLWSTLRELTEKYASSHVQLVHQLHELIKDIQRYNDELGKKIKKIRENETQTQNIVQAFQEIQQTLNKAKEQYHNLCIEYEKSRRQLDATQLSQYQSLSGQQQQISSSNLLNAMNQSTNMVNSMSGTSAQLGGPGTSPSSMSQSMHMSSSMVSQPTSSSSMAPIASIATSITNNRVTQLLKLEKKVKLALDDYKSSVDKYNSIRLEYERKLADSCNHFQYAEETHLKQMRGFIDAYSKLVSNINITKQQIYNEFSLKINEQYTIEYLIQTFIENKRTGVERPEVAQFIDISTTSSTPGSSAIGQTNQLNEGEFNLIITNANGAAINASSSAVKSTDLTENQTWVIETYFTLATIDYKYI